MSKITQLADYQPRRLAPEPWGHQLARARADAGHTVRSAAEALDGYPGLSRGTINRLEALEEVPTKATQRHQACILVVLYGYDPDDFGLGPDDVPPLVDLRTLAEQGVQQTRWYRNRQIVPIGPWIGEAA